MAYKDEWIEVTPTSTTEKQRVRKSTIGSYGKIGRTTYLFRDAFDQTMSLPIRETVDFIDDAFGAGGGGQNYTANKQSKDIKREGKSCANCADYSKPHERCVLKNLHIEEIEAINTICGDWRK